MIYKSIVGLLIVIRFGRGQFPATYVLCKGAAESVSWHVLRYCNSSKREKASEKEKEREREERISSEYERMRNVICLNVVLDNFLLIDLIQACFF
jgi:hypothetical protein